jgi:plasmid stabilization system protein ParE
MARLSVVWLPEALNDFQRLFNFLYEKNSEAAERAAATILSGANLLETTPHLGRPMSDIVDQRELFMSFGASSYVLRYKIQDDHTVSVLRVWHSKENRLN